MSASPSAISTVDRIITWAYDERMRLTGRRQASDERAKMDELNASTLLKIEKYGERIKEYLESDADVTIVAWHRATPKRRVIKRGRRR